jgi:hypothetical protein
MAFAAEVQRELQRDAGRLRPDICFYRARKRKANPEHLAEALKRVKQAADVLQAINDRVADPVPDEITRLLAGKTLFWLDPEAAFERAASHALDSNWPAVFASPLTKKLLATSACLWTWTKRTEITVETKMEGYKFRDFGDSDWDGDFAPGLFDGIADPDPLFPNHEDIKELARDVCVTDKDVFDTCGDPTDGDEVTSKSRHELFLTFLSTSVPVCQQEGRI